MAVSKKSVKPVAVATPVSEVKAEVKKDVAEVKVEKAPEKKEVAEKAPAKKEAAEKATAKKEAAKKAPAKKETKAVAAKAEKAPAKKEAVKKAPAKKAELTVAMEVQFAEKTYTQEALVKIAKDVWKYDLNQKPADLTSVELYVKPEESVVYYVMNNEFKGSFAI